MFARWCKAAALSLVASAGLTLADQQPMRNLDEFTKLADVKGGFPWQSFRSSDIVAPVFQINDIKPELVDQSPYIFIGSIYGNMRAGPMIIDARDFSLVFADQRYDNTYTSHAQIVNGKRYLIFWEGVHNRGHANGFGIVYDENYNLVYNVSAQGIDGTLADMHEMKLTEEGSVLFTTYWNIPYNCEPVNGPKDALLMDSGFQEVNASTNEIIFSWAASQWFDIKDTIAKYDDGFGVSADSGFDYFHINSVEKSRDGNYLISSRHLSILALIDGKDGHPIWILGGKRNQFKDLSGGNATNFGWQHDARFWRDENHITMFDNHGEDTEPCGDKACRTRGLHLEIDAVAMTVRIVQEYWHPGRIDAGAMGGMTPLDNGNVLIGWGYNPGFTEHTPDGKSVLDVQRGHMARGFQADMFAYRVSKGQWTGRPKWLPSVAIDAPKGTTDEATVYVSWNGATDVETWWILGSEYANNIGGHDHVIAVANKTGFETTIPLGSNPAGHRYIGAAAVDKHGTIMSSSFVIDTATGQPVLMPSYIKTIHEERPSPKFVSPFSQKTHTMLGAVGMFVVVVVVARYIVRRGRRWISIRSPPSHVLDYEKAMYGR